MIVVVASVLRGKIDPPEPLDRMNAELVKGLEWREQVMTEAQKRVQAAERWAKQMAGAG